MVLVSEAFREARFVKPIGELAACLDSINDLACFQDYKEKTWERLGIAAGARVLDVGCGVGYDVIGMAKRYPAAAIVGIDLSRAFLETARQRADALPNVGFAAANGAMLPFADGTFDAVRIDRSLQHAERPDLIVGEMTRVTRARGVVLAAEPDWGTFVLYNGVTETSDRLAHMFRNSFRNAFVGRDLQRLFVACGLRDLTVRAHPLVLTDYRSASVVYDLERLLSRCVSERVISSAAAEEWKARAIEASDAGAFFSHLSIVEVAGGRKGQGGAPQSRKQLLARRMGS
ncbi:MAG: methyltransferase domain-containing protein [Xanthobacteraceae bacterium]